MPLSGCGVGEGHALALEGPMIIGVDVHRWLASFGEMVTTPTGPRAPGFHGCPTGGPSRDGGSARPTDVSLDSELHKCDSHSGPGPRSKVATQGGGSR